MAHQYVIRFFVVCITEAGTKKATFTKKVAAVLNGSIAMFTTWLPVHDTA